jgi:hypothetical protein
MAADGSVNIPRIKPGDNIEAVNTALTAVERSLSEVREAAAAAKPTCLMSFNPFTILPDTLCDAFDIPALA